MEEEKKTLDTKVNQSENALKEATGGTKKQSNLITTLQEEKETLKKSKDTEAKNAARVLKAEKEKAKEEAKKAKEEVTEAKEEAARVLEEEKAKVKKTLKDAKEEAARVLEDEKEKAARVLKEEKEKAVKAALEKANTEKADAVEEANTTATQVLKRQTTLLETQKAVLEAKNEEAEKKAQLLTASVAEATAKNTQLENEVTDLNNLAAFNDVETLSMVQDLSEENEMLTSQIQTDITEMKEKLLAERGEKLAEREQKDRIDKLLAEAPKDVEMQTVEKESGSKKRRRTGEEGGAYEIIPQHFGEGYVNPVINVPIPQRPETIQENFPPIFLPEIIIDEQELCDWLVKILSAYGIRIDADSGCSFNTLPNAIDGIVNSQHADKLNLVTTFLQAKIQWENVSNLKGMKSIRQKKEVGFCVEIQKRFKQILEDVTLSGAATRRKDNILGYDCKIGEQLSGLQSLISEFLQLDGNALDTHRKMGVGMLLQWTFRFTMERTPRTTTLSGGATGDVIINEGNVGLFIRPLERGVYGFKRKFEVDDHVFELVGATSRESMQYLKEYMKTAGIGYVVFIPVGPTEVYIRDAMEPVEARKKVGDASVSVDMLIMG